MKSMENANAASQPTTPDRYYPQMSRYQISYLKYIQRHPGCSIMDVVKACLVNRDAGHKWVYDGVHRLEAQGVVMIDYIRGRTKLYDNATTFRRQPIKPDPDLSHLRKIVQDQHDRYLQGGVTS